MAFMAFMANSVNKASGIGSSPVARLLGAVPKRRLMKLATASPNIAPASSRAPVVAGSLRTGAPSAVAATAATTPRIVLDEPSEGHQPDFVRARVLTKTIAQRGYGRSSIPGGIQRDPLLGSASLHGARLNDDSWCERAGAQTLGHCSPKLSKHRVEKLICLHTSSFRIQGKSSPPWHGRPACPSRMSQPSTRESAPSSPRRRTSGSSFKYLRSATSRKSCVLDPAGRHRRKEVRPLSQIGKMVLPPRWPE